MYKKMHVIVSLIVVFSLIIGYFATEKASSSELNEKYNNRYDQGFRYNIQGWVYLHIEGAPYERGYQYGYLASDEIIDMIQRWSNLGHNFKFMEFFVIKNLPKNYEKLSEQWWNICRETSTKIFLKQVPEEYVKEMKGMTEGIKDRGGKIFGRDIEFEDIVASQFVQDIQYTISNSRKGFHPILDFLNGLKDIFSGDILNHDGHCNAFIATGDATSNGEIIVAHATVFPPYISERCNFIVDVKPSEGYRFTMVGPPGSLWSQEDWYQNNQGIILTETETTPQGPWKIRGTTPKGVRSRKAIQYSSSIDEVIRNLKDGNNGLIPNEWLIGDTKTGEIASYQQALYNTPTKRTFNGYYFSNCFPHSAKVLAELTGLPTIILKAYSKIFSKNGYFHIENDEVIWNQDVYQKLNELGERHYGDINEEIAKKIMTTYPITKLTTDCKITSSNLMRDMGMLAIMGNPGQDEWIPTEKGKEKFKGVTTLPVNGWVEIYPSASKPIIFSQSAEKIPSKNSKLLWTSEIEEESYHKTSISSCEVSGDYIYPYTDSGNVYTLDKKTGKNRGFRSIDRIKLKQDLENNSITASYLDRTVYGFDANAKITAIQTAEEDMVCFGSWDGKIYSIDSLTGEKNWDFETGWGIVTKPAVTENLVLFGSLDNNFYAVDKNNGELEWAFPCNAAIQSNPAVYGEYVFFGCDDGVFYALEQDTGKLGWKFKPKYSIEENKVNNYLTTPIIADPVIDDGAVYVPVGNIVYALDTQTTESELGTIQDTKNLEENPTMIILVMCLVAFFLFAIYMKRYKK